MCWHRRTGNGRGGFTLIEVIVSIGIMAIMAAIAVPPWNNYRGRAVAHEVANRLRSDLMVASSMALENQCAVMVKGVDDGTGNSVSYRVVKLQYDFVTKTYAELADVKTVDLTDLGVSTGNYCIIFAERGWVDRSGSSSDSVTGDKEVFNVNVSKPGVVNLQVQVRPTGRVSIV